MIFREDIRSERERIARLMFREIIESSDHDSRRRGDRIWNCPNIFFRIRREIACKNVPCLPVIVTVVEDDRRTRGKSGFPANRVLLSADPERSAPGIGEENACRHKEKRTRFESTSAHSYDFPFIVDVPREIENPSRSGINDVVQVCEDALRPQESMIIGAIGIVRSEEHTSELQSHSFISYAVFCLKTNGPLPPRLLPPAARDPHRTHRAPHSRERQPRRRASV